MSNTKNKTTNKTKKPITNSVSPLVHAAFQTVPRDIVLVEPGTAMWGTAHVIIRICSPTINSALRIPPQGTLGITMFPVPAGKIMADINSILSRIKSAETKALKKQADIDPALRQQKEIVQEIMRIVQREQQCYACQAGIMTLGGDKEVALSAMSRATNGAGVWQKPSHAWIHALQTVLPTAPPVAYPDSSVFFAGTKGMAEQRFPDVHPPMALPETPPVFYLGVGTRNNTPVIWAPWSAVNPLLAITGFSGSGKSVTMRLIWYQILSSQGIKSVLIDPKGEWAAQFANLPTNLSQKVAIIDNIMEYGLPQPSVLLRLVLKPSDIANAALRVSTLYSLLGGLVENQLGDVLRASLTRLYAREDWESIQWFDIYKQIPAQHKDNFVLLDPNGAYHTLFDPNSPPMPLKDTTVIGVESLTGAGSGDIKANDTIMTLLITALAERLKQHEKAIFGLDEAHAILRLPSTRRNMSTLSRVARSFGLSLIFASQFMADLYESHEIEEAIAQQCATRIVLRPAPADMEKIQSFGLSDFEAAIQAVQKAPSGSGLFIDSQWRMTPYFAMLPPTVSSFCLAT